MLTNIFIIFLKSQVNYYMSVLACSSPPLVFKRYRGPKRSRQSISRRMASNKALHAEENLQAWQIRSRGGGGGGGTRAANMPCDLQSAVLLQNLMMKTDRSVSAFPTCSLGNIHLWMVRDGGEWGHLPLGKVHLL